MRVLRPPAQLTAPHHTFTTSHIVSLHQSAPPATHHEPLITDPRSTQHAVVMARCLAEDPVDDDGTHIFEALKIVATLEGLYSGDGPGPPRALDPVHQLAPLTERIGRSPEAWRRAWGHVEALDQQGALTLSHLNVMIAAIAQLPDGAALDATLPGASTDTSEVRAACCAVHPRPVHAQACMLLLCELCCCAVWCAADSVGWVCRGKWSGQIT